MSKIKKTLLFLLVLSVCVSALFFGTILSAIAEKSFRGFCKECLSAKIKAEHVKYGDRVVSFENIQFADRHDANKVHLTSDEILLYFEPHFFKREIDLYVTFIDPKIDAALLPQILGFLSKNFDSYGLFKINTQVQIKNGILKFQNDDDTQDIYIHLDHDFIDAKELNLKISLDAPNDDQNMMELKGYRGVSDSTSDIFFVDLDFKEMSCQKLHQALIANFKDFENFDIQKGVLNGNLKVEFHQDKNYKIKSNLVVDDVQYNYKPLKLSGNIPKAQLVFNEENQGLLDLENVSCEKQENDEIVFNLDLISGQCKFDSIASFKLNLKGFAHHKQQPADISLFVEKNHDTYVFDLEANKEGREVSLKARSKANFAEFKVKNFGPEELLITQSLLADSIPELCSVTFQSGLIDAEFKIKTLNSKLEKLKLVSFKSENIKASLPAFDLELNANTLSGKFEADLLSNDFFKELSLNFAIDQGILSLNQFTEPILTEMTTELIIENGEFKPSIIFGKFFGLEGKSHLDFSHKDQLLHLEFTGDAKEFIAFFPEVKRKGLLSSFQDDGLKISADLKKLVDARTLQDIFVITGETKILSKFAGADETVLFGFEIEKAIDSESKFISDYSVKNGWFKADHLNLEKYIAPFIFHKNQMKMKGYADFDGSFDETKMHIAYNAQHASLENELFVMETALIENAGYSFDFKKAVGTGTIPIKDATYFDKNHGLLFTEIQANFELSEDQIQVPFIEAFSNGIYFSGTKEIDLSHYDDEEFTVKLHLKTMKGKLSQLQDLFSHFNKPAFFLKMPIESDILLRQEGAMITFNFKPEGCVFDATVQGEISEATIKSDNFDVSLQDLNVNFDYNTKANDLVFSDIQGTLFVGKPGRVEEYLVAGDRVHFTDYCKSESTFDLWVGDKNRDIIRIVGKTKAKDDDLIDIVLNHELSHFGDMHPCVFKCCLKDWCLLQTLNVDFEFKIDHLFKDLQRFSRTGFFFLSRSLLKELNELTGASGDFNFHLDYDLSKSLFNYQAKGINVEIGPYKFDLANLKGTKSSQNWSLEELKLDQLTIAADIEAKETGCKINFLGIQLGSCLLAGLKGEYRKDENAFLTDIHLFEANLGFIKEIPFFETFAKEFQPTGKFKGFGKLKVELGKGPSGIESNLNLKGSLHDFSALNLVFDDMDQLNLHYTDAKGITCEGIDTALVLEKEQESKVDLNAAKIHYKFSDNTFFVDGLHFKLPASDLKNLTDLLAKTFKKNLSEEILSVVNESKKTGFFEGTLNLDISKPYYALHLLLKDGSYRFLDTDHSVKGFCINFDPCEFKLSTLYTYQEKDFLLDLSSKSSKLDYGKLELKTERFDDSPLTIYWRNYKDTGIAIEAAEGTLLGANIELYRNQDVPLQCGIFHLTGDVNVDMQQLSALFSVDLTEKIKTWQIQKGYNLKGNWSFFDGKSFDLKSSTFNGELFGNDFEFKGYQFQKLQAEIDYCKDQIAINNLQLEDPCGMLYAKEMKLSLVDSDALKLTLPLLKIEDFRPSMIRLAGTQTNPSKRPLVITELELEDVQGSLLDENSFKGHGRFSFKNPHKRNFQNTILAIPAEIISRIGLNLTVLTPVIGTVEYQVLDGKVLLNKFQDVYSEGRLSRFYLATTPYPSYVDFEGNLFMKVRMKQYNLLFKLAELFVVSIEGNLRKPTYSLQKQVKHELPAGLAVEL